MVWSLLSPKVRIYRKKEGIGGLIKMSKYIVAGGIFKNEEGEEWFDLI